MTSRIDILTPFPQTVEAVIGTSILGRAATKGLITYRLHNLFDYADPPHNKIDDDPFGGGSGMILKPEPVFRAFDAALEGDDHPSEVAVVFPAPDGKPFRQADAAELAGIDRLVFICGHYKGTDQRIRDELVTHEFSVGDFVVTGGELPALLMLDAVVRLCPGVLNSQESAETDSFSTSLLDGPHYTRPRDYRGLGVPEVLLSGDHGAIAEWRQAQRERHTRDRRPDIWEKFVANKGH